MALKSTATPYCMMACSGLLAVLFVTARPGPASAADPWPEGLREAASAHFHVLQVNEYLTRDSALSKPAGIRPMAAFDRETHRCHDVPGQVYRLYGKPRYAGKEGDGVHLVRSGFDLYYRQAATIAEVFSQPWAEGSGGVLQVAFRPAAGGWEAVGTREMLDDAPQ